MGDVSVTDLRSRLQHYLKRVQSGEQITVTSRGRVIARIVPEESERRRARRLLAGLRPTAKIGDVVSPIEVSWAADGDTARHQRDDI